MDKQELSPKVQAVYLAIVDLFAEGADLNTLTVSEITARAGIGKGTVYDYFSNKEEMLAGALYHEMSVACQELYEKLKSKENLFEKMEQILFDMENYKQKMECAFKVVHLLMDNSQVSKQLREILHKKENYEIPIYQLLQMLIKEEFGEDSKISEEDMLYLVMNTISRLICYAMYLSHSEVLERFGTRTMRERLCKDVCRDVESYKQPAAG